MTDAITFDGGAAVKAVSAKSGFWYHWGPQAWIDMWMSNSMLVKRAMPIVTHSLLPILRLSGDKDAIDAGYKDIKSRRETLYWKDSPREKWRKRYGNFVREVEWGLLELRKYYSQAQYEEIVIGTCVSTAEETTADFIAMMQSMAEKNEGKTTVRAEPSRWEKFLFDTFNPAGFLTGPAEMRDINMVEGSMTMYVPDCGWHTCAAQASLPNPEQLPAEGCQLICKGAFEALFNGDNGGLRMEFEPHLPETSCTVRMRWK
ncbi:hypothetical protein EYC98_05295 [Halieaceae bacterium IMCC14734]|uniref:Uncharacterized protein n=1 Tax=Candidatus Litorirhabdus singularis TaxID=2518993 RepID=A0ABT3TDD2_9GAMM|nr:hypothetical protein [Candidatus Litorirhabdus singularis]MCX2980283.1 hypothetical protein [Candidatus Litorirhabdus singularis]